MLQVNVCIEVIDTAEMGQPAIVRVIRAETVIPNRAVEAIDQADLLAATLGRLNSEAQASAQEQMGQMREFLVDQAEREQT